MGDKTFKLLGNTGLAQGGIHFVKEEEDGCRTVYRADYPDGCGRMTVFSVLPGAELVFDDFDTAECYCGIQQSKNVMQINYCREGRSECELQNGFYRYLGKGDLSVGNLSDHAIQMGFPLGYYKGVDIAVHMDGFPDSISRFFPGASLNITDLRRKLCSDDMCFIMRAKDTVEHIFSDLYNIPPYIQTEFFRLRILEMLVYLSAIDVSGCNEKRRMVEAPAEEYGISRTALKSCFKGIYGASIGEFMKNYRMQTAAALLTETNRSVLEISEHVGYENQSRFAAAFKGVMGKSPQQYRKAAAAVCSAPGKRCRYFRFDFMDEATSNVDPENESLLQTAIEALTKDKTIIMIAHRLKTVRNASRILAVDGGEIVQRGTHEELMQQGGLYADFIGVRKKAIGWKLAQTV